MLSLCDLCAVHCISVVCYYHIRRFVIENLTAWRFVTVCLNKISTTSVKMMKMMMMACDVQWFGEMLLGCVCGHFTSLQCHHGAPSSCHSANVLWSLFYFNDFGENVNILHTTSHVQFCRSSLNWRHAGIFLRHFVDIHLVTHSLFSLHVLTVFCYIFSTFSKFPQSHD